MNITDIMIHIHPDLSAKERSKVEELVGNQDAVVSVHFSPKLHHEMTVAYNPESINSQTILGLVRQWDKDAMMAGL